MPKPKLTTSIIEWIEENRSLIDSLKLDQVYKSGDYISRPFLTYSLLKIGINPLKYVTEMPGNFARNLDITDIEIPKHITEIANLAFAYCNRLTGISLHDGITSIGHDSFNRCESLTNLIIPDSVVFVGSGSFTFCSHLVNVDIGKGKLSIEDSAFSNCNSLTKVVMGGGVVSLGTGVFYNCQGLKEIIYRGTLKQWKNIDKSGSWNIRSSLKKVICTDGEINLEQ